MTAIRLALPVLLAPAAAAAHAGPEGHLHPHGAEVLLLGLLAVAAVWAVRRLRP